MASQTGICNQALVQVGQESVTAIDSSTRQGRVCLAVWSMALDAMLEAHAWGFATKRVDLQQLSETPAFGFTHAYAVPSDNIRVLELSPDTEYALEAGKILSDEEELSLKYVYRVTQTGLFPPWFALAMSDAVAARICFAFEGSARKRQMLEEIAARSLSIAIAKDSRQAWQSPGPTDADDSWLTARGASSDTEVLTIESED